MKHLPIEPDNRLNMVSVPFIAKLTATVSAASAKLHAQFCALFVWSDAIISASHLLMPAAAGATFTSLAASYKHHQTRHIYPQIQSAVESGSFTVRDSSSAMRWRSASISISAASA